MENLTKREIVQKIYQSKSGALSPYILQTDVRDIVQKTLDIISEALASGRNAELRNFGILEVQVRKPRVGRNPTQPQNNVVIPKRAVVKFKAGKELKKELKLLDLSLIEASKQARARK